MSYSIAVIHHAPRGCIVIPDAFTSRHEAIAAAEALAESERALVLVDRDQDGECVRVVYPPTAPPEHSGRTARREPVLPILKSGATAKVA